jgi:hypothetical protein
MHTSQSIGYMPELLWSDARQDLHLIHGIQNCAGVLFYKPQFYLAIELVYLKRDGNVVFGPSAHFSGREYFSCSRYKSVPKLYCGKVSLLLLKGIRCLRRLRQFIATRHAWTFSFEYVLFRRSHGRSASAAGVRIERCLQYYWPPGEVQHIVFVFDSERACPTSK